MKELIIRQAEQIDFDKLIPIYNEFIDYHKQFGESFKKVENAADLIKKYHENENQNDNAGLFVALINSELVGFCFCIVQNKPPVYIESIIGEIGSIVVKQEFQRRGIGKQLLNLAFEWFKLKGIKRIETQFVISNPKSSAFWAKMDFTPFIESTYLNLEL